MSSQASEDETSIVGVGEAPMGTPEVVRAQDTRRGSIILAINDKTVDNGPEKAGSDAERRSLEESSKEVSLAIITPSSQVDLLEAKEVRSPASPVSADADARKLSIPPSFAIGRGRSVQYSVADLWQDTHKPRQESVTPLDEGQSPESTTDGEGDRDRTPVELPAAPVSKKKHRSFFEIDSDSDNEGFVRTASRASSVRNRPKLVDLQSSPGSRHRYYRPNSKSLRISSGPSREKAERILGTTIKDLYDLTPSTADAPEPLHIQHSPAAGKEKDDQGSTKAFAPTPPSVSDDKESTDDATPLPTTPQRRRLDAYSISSQSKRFSLSPLDALKSNPVDALALVSLQRAVSAPPLPLRRLRKVTIAPVDIEAARTNSKPSLRDLIVSTPFPRGSISSPTALHHSTLPSSLSHIAPPEILVLEICLAHHPQSSKLVTIPVYTRASFDDHALFLSLENTYTHTLLSRTQRYLTALTLFDADLTLSSSSTVASFPSASQLSLPSPQFDAADFLKHLLHPPSGHRRKTWLQWLRRHQPQSRTINTPASAPGGPTPIPAPLIPKITLYHSYSVLRIAVVAAVFGLLAVLAVLMWVFFGLPGRGAGTPGWREDAGRHVLSGLVLGGFVSCLGSVVVGGWMWGSRHLL